MACEIVGRIRLFNDDPDAALSAFREFKTVVVALSAADPANTQYRRRVADSHRRISEVRAAQGDTAGALRGYQRALDIMTTMLHDDPDDTILQGDRAEVLKVIDALGASKVQDVQRSRP